MTVSPTAKVEAVSGLGKPFNKQGTLVRHKFYLDEEGGAGGDVRQSAVAPPSEHPRFDFTRHVTIDPVTEPFVQYLKEGSMTFELVSQPYAAPAAAAAAATAAAAAEAAVTAAAGAVPGIELVGLAAAAAVAGGGTGAAEETPRETRLERQL